MKINLPEIRPEERTPLVETLLATIRQLADQLVKLELTLQELRDENARLKGQKTRPDIKPSTLEQPAKPGTPTEQTPRRRGKPNGPRTADLVIDQTIPLLTSELPQGAKFRQREDYVVQELEIRTVTTKYQRARYDLADGGSFLTPFPPGILPVEGGHFGAKLVAYVLSQHYQAHVTQPVLLEALWDMGIVISAGQLQRLLTEHKDAFHEEKAEILRVGLTSASYIGTDDTGARHQGQNGYTTAIGNDFLASFTTTDSKSRLNFLQLLQGEQRLYSCNAAAQAYWKEHHLPQEPSAKLTQGETRDFASEEAWKTHLAALDIRSERHVLTATEGALLGGLIEHGVSPELVVVSDGALQFVIVWHAACWIHAERPLLKMVPHNEEHRVVIEGLREQIWELYKDLKAYKAHPDETQRGLLEARFDALVDQRTGYPNVNQVLKSLRKHKADLLRVLVRPEPPLHNNAMESDIRDFVKRRKISGGTRSDSGRRCRDTFASLKKTCRKLGVNFWAYLQDRVSGLGGVPRLASVVCEKVQAAKEKVASLLSGRVAEPSATEEVAVPV
jgi:hypothetical protein